MTGDLGKIPPTVLMSHPSVLHSLRMSTAPPLAKEIAQYVNCLWQSRSDRIHLLEPALGTGAFFSALRQALPADLIESALGVEIDREFAETADHLWQNTGLVTLNADFTVLQPPAAERRANLIVTNPPYVRHHHLGGDEKTRLKLAAEQILGKGVSGLTGLYCYFILLAHQWLADDGIGVWLIPSEFMDVNYGAALKNYLTSKVTLLHIHRFDPLEVQFGDALVSSAVVVYRKTPPATGHTVKFSFGGSLTKPGRERIMPARTLARVKKWSRILNGRATVKASRLLPTQNAKPLSSLFAVKRGLATGANDFFILPKEYALRLGVSERFLKPILPSPRHLRANIIESDLYGDPLLENPLVLIDSNLPEEDLKESCPALWEYLREGEKFPNGDQWGWQAKFYYPEARLTGSRKTSIKESLQRACELHPNLKCWFLCTPGKLTPDEQDWFDNKLRAAKHNRRPVVPDGHPVKLDNWTESDFIGWMSEERFAGIRLNFFGELELTKEWFRRQFEKQIEGVGDKFIPSLHTETDEERRVHQLLGDYRFAERLCELLGDLAEAYDEHCKQVTALRKFESRLVDWERYRFKLLTLAENL